MPYHHTAARVLNTPLLVEPGYARVFLGALASRLGIAQLIDEHGAVESQAKLRMRADAFEPDRPRERPYKVIDGIALLPVSGSLVHKLGYVNPYSGMTGYDGLITRVQGALEDPDVDGILLDFDSPGGEVAGCFDCARKIASYRGIKPIGAVSYDMACSAAMALASAADVRYVTSTAQMGSIGVVMMHVNMEQRLKEQGYEVTLIHSGALKVAGNPYQALPEEVLQRFQAESDALRRDFAQLISDHMGLDVDAVLATEAAVFTGQAAIDIGLADELVNGHDMLAAFRGYITTTKTMGVITMSKDQTQPAASTQPEVAPQAAAPAVQEPTATDARKAEQERIQGILQCVEAEGREKLAQHFAFTTDMTVDQARAALAAAEAAKPQASSLLDAAMGNTEQPGVGAAMGTETSTPAPEAELVRDYRAATGRSTRH